jgi:hypothetical protein
MCHVAEVLSLFLWQANLLKCVINKSSESTVGPVAQSVFRLATGWTVWGSNRVGGEFSAPVQTGSGAHPASCTMGTGSFPGVKSCRGVTLTPHPLLVPLVMKEYSYTSTQPMGRTVCTEPQCLYKGAL